MPNWQIRRFRMTDIITRLDNLIIEMADEMTLASGQTITKKALVKLKKDTKNFNEFISRIQKKAKLTNVEKSKLERMYDQGF